MTSRSIIFLDLDGVITREESFATLDRNLGLGGSLAGETLASCRLDINPEAYAMTLRRRLARLRPFPPQRLARIISTIPLHPELAAFATANSGRTLILTSNLDILCRPLIDNHLSGCRAIMSCGALDANGCIDPDASVIVDKASVILRARERGFTTVMVGDSANDIPALRAADIPIAAAYSPALCPEASAIARFSPSSPSILIDILNSL